MNDSVPFKEDEISSDPPRFTLDDFLSLENGSLDEFFHSHDSVAHEENDEWDRDVGDHQETVGLNRVSDASSEKSIRKISSINRSKPFNSETKEYPPHVSMNAVHMEIQENAKIPNLYKWDGKKNSTADRDKKLPNPKCAPDSEIMDEIMRLSANDLNLTEEFLGCEKRLSASAAYSCSGALMSSIGSQIGRKLEEKVKKCEIPNDDDDKGEVHDREKKLNSMFVLDKTESIVREKNRKDDDPIKNVPLRNNFNSGLGIVSTDKQKGGYHEANKSAKPSCTVLPSVQPVNTATVPLGGNIDLSHIQHPYERSVPLPIPTRHSSQLQHANISSKTISSMDPKIISLSDKTQNTQLFNFPQNTTPLSPNRYIELVTTKAKQGSPVIALSNVTPHKKAKVIKPYLAINHVSRNVSHYSRINKKANNVTALSASPSLIEATKTRSQLGFGGNHVVPSIPPPPFVKGIKRKAELELTKKSASTSLTSLTSTSKKGAELCKLASSNAKVVLAGPSYEKKKQRAKDARVSLNKSIDSLSIAINMSGMQSKQYATLFQAYLATPPLMTSEKGKANVEGKKAPKCHSSTAEEIWQNSLTETMNDVVKTADSSKKWDRPSFVRTAAQMVQDLNALCEILMRKILSTNAPQHDQLHMHKRMDKQSNATGNLSKPGNYDSIPLCECGGRVKTHSQLITGAGPPPTIISHNDFDSKDDMESHRDSFSQYESPELNDCKVGHINEVVIQVIETMELVNIDLIMKCDSVMYLISSYLDPTSLSRCVCVSQKWKINSIYSTDEIWMEFCIRRFGRNGVRQWQEKEIRENSRNNYMPIDNNIKKLYRNMSVSNVKPKCLLEGNIYLGKGKLSNIVSAWVSAVERSNGETLRSVQTDCTGQLLFSSLPVVEIRIFIQNTGMADGPVYVPEQIISIDSSTRRSREEMFEITSDRRLVKRVLKVDGSPLPSDANTNDKRFSNLVGDVFQLKLFECVVLIAHIHTRTCSTISKFIQRAKFMKLLIRVNGVTQPLVIPFFK